MTRLSAVLSAMIIFMIPAAASASSVNAWNDADKSLLAGLSIISVIVLVFFIYSMLRDNG
ncbi:hypothetical protein [Salibacterium halotolerans]|uniref:Uncharacterized protein n=1 Tax=Salibacterium halotolerans TaxID=1884432 RepID=A0A1I5QAI3_9BACI|nr:hypothetical protein [Salibacterium halotolerans]SFP43265.1 hypothetical protein SAMN05518683_10586 [Salibacterium halotolerans]